MVVLRKVSSWEVGVATKLSLGAVARVRCDFGGDTLLHLARRL